MSKILIVDDEAYVSTQLEERLTIMGYEVVGRAHSGEASIAMSKKFHPDLVLMDIVMPGKLDGISAAEIIRKEHDIPVIFLTGYAGDQFIDRAKHVEPYGYIVKPFQVKEIKASIEIALHKKNMEDDKMRLETQFQKAQKMEAVATLAAGIAHQFNNALSPVSIILDMLEMDYPGNEEIANYTEKMKDSTFRMADLTSQLLAYARGGKYQANTVSINDFMESTLPIIHHVINPDIEIITDLIPHALTIMVDRAQMQMVMSAVIVNASEAIDGKGIIKITVKDEEIDEEHGEYHSGFKPGHYVCIKVEDNGKGMDKETREKIFEPFFSTKFEGRGLGMAAVYGIVKNHDGWISVDSELGQGTTVRIFFPAAEANVKKLIKPKVEPAKETGTILVIEDEAMIMGVCRALLERLGYRSLGASTGEEAINIAKTFDGDIDLALLDIVLPDMGGKEIYPIIMEARPNMKVIVFSGYSIAGPAEEILDAGAQAFIQKPFSIAEISEKLKEVLESK